MELKKELKKLVSRILKLEEMAHPPRKFVVCEDCKKQIKEKDNGANHC